MASASQITVYQIGGSFALGGKTCEHVNARAALHDASARVGMFASRIPFSQLSKNDSSLPSEKKRSTLYLSPVVVENDAKIIIVNVENDAIFVIEHMVNDAY